MEIAIAVFIGFWFTLAGGFSTWMIVKDYNKELKKLQNSDSEENHE